MKCTRCKYYDSSCNACTGDAICIGEFDELKEKLEKYRWHDLLENHDDLPNNKDDEETICLVKHIELAQDIYGDEFEYYSYSTATYDGDGFVYGTGFSISESKIMNVVAWREIE